MWLAASPTWPVARQVAVRVRGDGVRTLGLQVGERVQVSMNLVDPLRRRARPRPTTGARRSRCTRRIGGGRELVGLVPDDVLQAIPVDRWSELDLSADRTIEARLAAC